MNNKLKTKIILLKECQSANKLVGDSMRVTQLLKTSDHVSTKSDTQEKPTMKIVAMSKPFRVHRYKTQTSFSINQSEI